MLGPLSSSLIGLEDPIGPDNPSGSDQTVWLLKNPILREDFEIDNPDHQETWTSYLSAEPVKVLKTALHLNEDKRNEDEDIDWNSRSGSYAYIGRDEG